VDILIQGGTLIDPSQGTHGQFDLLVSDGLVAEIADRIDPAGKTVIDAVDKLVIPGLIDLHTHLREPGGEQKETVLTGCRAAAAGGYTGITALPNTNPVMDDWRTINYVNMLADRAGLVRVWPVGAVSKGSAGKEMADIGTMVQAGVKAVTDDGRGVTDARLLKNALLTCKQFGIPLLEHCEEESLSGDGQLHEGLLAAKLGLPGIPVSAETVMLARDLLLAEESGGRLHIMHVSTAKAVAMIRQAKEAGLHVTAEVTPHHLLLTEEAADGFNAMAKMKPPLRTAADVRALRLGLADGTIDAVATDHAPHTEAEKTGDFQSAPFGIVGLETAFPLLYTHLVMPGLLTLDQLIDRMSCRPATILGVAHGSLKTGFAADLALIDIKNERVIDRQAFLSKGKNTPFDSWPVYGVPVLTMVAGRVIMRDGMIVTI
jgi:dihydroorotase